jgi:capsular polysaccharide biosynthesis protein
MKAIFSSKSYWIISILAGALIFSATLGLGKIYRSEIDVFVFSKNYQTGDSINQMAENAAQITKTLAFYNDLLTQNPQIKDLVSGQSDTIRKNYWDSEVQTQRIGDSGMVRIIVSDKNQTVANNLSQASIKTLETEIQKYYGSDGNSGITISDGPIVNQEKIYNNTILFPASLFVSFLAVLLSFLVSDVLKDMQTKRKFSKMQKKKNSQKLLSHREAEEKLNQLISDNYSA